MSVCWWDGPCQFHTCPQFSDQEEIMTDGDSASSAKLLNFTEKVQNVLSESYLGSFLRKRFSPSGELQLLFRVSASLSVRRCLFHASYTAAEAYLGQGLNLADATQLALQTPSFIVPFLSSPSAEKSGKGASRFSCSTCGSFSLCFCNSSVPWFIYKLYIVFLKTMFPAQNQIKRLHSQ